MRPVFIWLTELNYKGEVAPLKSAYAVAHILKIATGIQRTTPGTKESWTPGSEIDLLTGIAENMWHIAVLEQPDTVVMLAEGGGGVRTAHPRGRFDANI